jgi:hypothetical protein
MKFVNRCVWLDLYRIHRAVQEVNLFLQIMFFLNLAAKYACNLDLWSQNLGAATLLLHDPPQVRSVSLLSEVIVYVQVSNHKDDCSCIHFVHSFLLLHVVFQQKLAFYPWRFSSKHDVYSVLILICMHADCFAAVMSYFLKACHVASVLEM